MTEELKLKLRQLADKYENTSFPDADPCQFLRWFDLEKDGVAAVECASFIAAMLAFGNRKQFIPKIKQILTAVPEANSATTSGQNFLSWLQAGAPGFPDGQAKFYRFYSYDDMHCLFKELGQVTKKYGSLGEAGRQIAAGEPVTGFWDLADCLASLFPESAIVPKGKSSANKRLCMYLRWMVRRNSPVDLGIWTWASPADLLIPLDVHVMQEGVNLGLLAENATASRKTARQLSAMLNEAFPGDPARGDFALFGLGVD